MTNFTDITLAMDLSLTSPGFAVLAVFEGEPIILEASHVKTDAKQPHGARLSQISHEIMRLASLYEPEHVVREKGFSRFPAVTQTLFKVVGVSDLTLNQFGIYVGKSGEISPTSVKKAVTGNGRADKQAVQDAVMEILQLERIYFANDDESDAAAVGIAYLKQEGLIE